MEVVPPEPKTELQGLLYEHHEIGEMILDIEDAAAHRRDIG